MYYKSPIGWLKINIAANFITEITFLDGDPSTVSDPSNELATEAEKQILKKCKEEFDEYFCGKRKVFDLPLKQSGTFFQETVWSQLLTIPYGETTSYLRLARGIGNVKSIRAVGAANGKNNLSIVVPCHRVIGSNGSLIGYAGGLWRKQWLLEHENKYANGVSLLF